MTPYYEDDLVALYRAAKVRPIVAGATRIITRPTGVVCARCWEEERE